MMTPEWLTSLARYNHWMNEKLYSVASNLSDEARKQDQGAFFKSIHGTFNHLLVADRIWLARFMGESTPEGFIGPGIRSLDEVLYPDFEQLRAERTITDEKLSDWVSQVTVERLHAPLVFLRRGQRQELPLWWAVAHLFNHQTHHRGQITTLFTQQGVDPGVTDLFVLLREEAVSTSQK